MPIARVLFESESTEWETPLDLFRLLDAEFHFDLDAAATDENAKCSRYFTKRENGLQQEWKTSVFLNPPYGISIGKWVRKAYEEAHKGSLVVCLLPARTDVKWWHDFVMQAAEVRFIKGRVKFVGGESSAPFPSVVAVFRPGHNGLPAVRRLTLQVEGRRRGVMYEQASFL